MQNNHRFINSKRQTSKLSKSLGFTLIELMIVIAIVAILTTIAYASYENSVIKSKRKASTACLMEHAQFMERTYTTTLRYHPTSTTLTAFTVPTLNCATDLTGIYNFTVTASTTAYTATATPQANQAARDAGCGTLSLNQQGTKAVTGAKGVDTCWNR
jgi:type IV pilus assembly protein PilE